MRNIVHVLNGSGCRYIGPGHEIGGFPSAEIAIGADLRGAFQDTALGNEPQGATADEIPRLAASDIEPIAASAEPIG
jgi:hypothetical protein